MVLKVCSGSTCSRTVVLRDLRRRVQVSGVGVVIASVVGCGFALETRTMAASRCTLDLLLGASARGNRRSFDRYVERDSGRRVEGFLEYFELVDASEVM